MRLVFARLCSHRAAAWASRKGVLFPDEPWRAVDLPDRFMRYLAVHYETLQPINKSAAGDAAGAAAAVRSGAAARGGNTHGAVADEYITFCMGSESGSEEEDNAGAGGRAMGPRRKAKRHRRLEESGKDVVPGTVFMDVDPESGATTEVRLPACRLAALLTYRGPWQRGLSTRTHLDELTSCHAFVVVGFCESLHWAQSLQSQEATASITSEVMAARACAAH